MSWFVICGVSVLFAGAVALSAWMLVIKRRAERANRRG
jgi:hypothetical protein